MPLYEYKHTSNRSLDTITKRFESGYSKSMIGCYDESSKTQGKKEPESWDQHGKAPTKSPTSSVEELTNYGDSTVENYSTAGMFYI